MRPKPRKQGPDRAPGPLDDKARELAAQEATILEEIARRKRLIEQAPERARELALRRRNELIDRASRTDARPGSRVALPDRRFSELNVAVPARQKALRADRRRGRLTFFVLTMIVIGLVFWLIQIASRA